MKGQKLKVIAVVLFVEQKMYKTAWLIFTRLG
jgi:hypothetical protein